MNDKLLQFTFRFWPRTSACFLFEFSKLQLAKTPDDPALLDRHALLFDLYNKARSYAFLNKVFFWLMLPAAVLVLLWPSLAVVGEDLGKDYAWLKDAVVQTTVTGLAALGYALYNHYKKRQAAIESLMRRLLFSRDSKEAAMENIIREVERLDGGFIFRDSPPGSDRSAKS